MNLSSLPKRFAVACQWPNRSCCASGSASAAMCPWAKSWARLRSTPTRLTTDSIVLRLQKAGATRPVRAANQDDEDDFVQEPDDDEEAADGGDDEEEPKAPKVRKAPTTTRRPAGAAGQIGEILDKNWAKAKDSGLKPPEMTTDRFVRTAQSAVGEPKPTVARVLQAVQKLSKQDVLITPNLVADEIIETDELR